MQHSAVSAISRAVEEAQRFAHASSLDACDADDIDEVIVLVNRELQRAQPNLVTLSTLLSSLVRSLKADSKAREVYTKLEEAMREAGVPEN
jgi:hypothetical protein